MHLVKSKEGIWSQTVQPEPALNHTLPCLRRWALRFWVRPALPCFSLLLPTVFNLFSPYNSFLNSAKPSPPSTSWCVCVCEHARTGQRIRGRARGILSEGGCEEFWEMEGMGQIWTRWEILREGRWEGILGGEWGISEQGGFTNKGGWEGFGGREGRCEKVCEGILREQERKIWEKESEEEFWEQESQREYWEKEGEKEFWEESERMSKFWGRREDMRQFWEEEAERELWERRYEEMWVREFWVRSGEREFSEETEREFWVRNSERVEWERVWGILRKAGWEGILRGRRMVEF